jgi:hypothetical protein
MTSFRAISFLYLLLLSFSAIAQDDLLKMLEEEVEKDKKPEHATATFKTTRLINGHSVETVAGGVLDFRISHRFGYLNSGGYELFGLDQASIRLGLEYGLTSRWMIGIGRSSFEKQFDGFTKYKLLRQSSGKKSMPVTLDIMAAMVYKSMKFENSGRENFQTSKMYYTFQGLIARKFSEGISFQIMPTVNHYNLIPGTTIPNDLLSVGVGGRFKLSKRLSINAEYYYQIPDYRLPDTRNSIGLGIDLETGGHVFQLYVTNSTGMTERTFISETTGDFLNGDIHFGFCISRVFTLKDPRE